MKCLHSALRRFNSIPFDTVSFFDYSIIQGVFFRASAWTLLLYSVLLWMNSWYASDCAGLLGLGSSSKSWIPIKTCFKVIAGRQPSSSFKIERQIVPDGYTLGWKRGGTNLPAGFYFIRFDSVQQYNAMQERQKKKGDAMRVVCVRENPWTAIEPPCEEMTTIINALETPPPQYNIIKCNEI